MKIYTNSVTALLVLARGAFGEPVEAGSSLRGGFGDQIHKETSNALLNVESDGVEEVSDTAEFMRIKKITCHAPATSFDVDGITSVLGIIVAAGCTLILGPASAGTTVAACIVAGSAVAAAGNLSNGDGAIDLRDVPRATYPDQVFISHSEAKVWPPGKDFQEMNTGDSQSPGIDLYVGDGPVICLEEYDFWSDDLLGCLGRDDVRNQPVGEVVMYVESPEEGSVYEMEVEFLAGSKKEVCRWNGCGLGGCEDTEFEKTERSEDCCFFCGNDEQCCHHVRNPVDTDKTAGQGQLIKAVHGKCLDASQRNQNGGKVHMWNCDASNHNQQWAYNPTLKQIKNVHGKCLDASERNDDGGKVHMWDCATSNPNQQWVYNPTTKQIKAVHGKCLDASERNDDGGKVHMWGCDTSNPNQQWEMKTGAVNPAVELKE